MSSLTPDELQRYQRHLILPEVGRAGQERLKAASVLIVGAGGLGSPLALYLAAAGVGRLGLVDFDMVDASNLHRQVLHGTAAVGSSKLVSARARLEDLNPHVALELHETRLTRANALDLIRPYDVVADGTDNFATRYLVNDACVLTGTPNVYASIYRFEGQVSVFGAPDGPCYRCVYPTPPPPELVPSCAAGGVLGVLPGTVGTMQATEVVKLLLGLGTPLIGRLLLYDALAMQTRTMRVPRDPACPLCGTEPTIRELIDYEAFCGTAAAGPPDEAVPELTAPELARRLDAPDPPLLLDVRTAAEHKQSHLDGLFIPLADLEQRLDELKPHRGCALVVYCRSGARSARAVALLRARGFDAANLAGGVQAWQRDIDPTFDVA